MTALADWAFELGGVGFGCGTSVDVTGWEPSGAIVRDQDHLADFGDHRVFGTDRVTPESWSLTLTVKERDEASALATLDPLRGAWDARAARVTPQAVVPLRYRVGGRSRVVFVRPRRFTPVLGNVIFGRVPVVAGVDLAHLGSFGDEAQQSSPLRLDAADLSGRGFVLPVELPVLVGGAVPGPRHTTIVVGGQRDTHLDAEIAAGAELLTDPYLIVDGRVVQTYGTLQPGETVVVRGAPWDARLDRADGSDAPLSLAPGSRLADLTVPPGQHTVSFGGIDGSGTASCRVVWRPAFHSI